MGRNNGQLIKGYKVWCCLLSSILHQYWHFVRISDWLSVAIECKLHVLTYYIHPLLLTDCCKWSSKAWCRQSLHGQGENIAPHDTKPRIFLSKSKMRSLNYFGPRSFPALLDFSEFFLQLVILTYFFSFNVFSPSLYFSQALIENLDLSRLAEISIQTVADNGFCSEKSSTRFNEAVMQVRKLGLFLFGNSEIGCVSLLKLGLFLFGNLDIGSVSLRKLGLFLWGNWESGSVSLRKFAMFLFEN